MSRRDAARKGQSFPTPFSHFQFTRALFRFIRAISEAPIAPAPDIKLRAIYIDRVCGTPTAFGVNDPLKNVFFLFFFL